MNTKINYMRAHKRPPKEAQNPVPVLVMSRVDVHREGLKRCLKDSRRFVAWAEADTVDSALEAIEVVKPEVAIVDCSLGAREGIRLMKQISAHHKDVRILAMFSDERLDVMERALQAGAIGCIMVNESVEDILLAVRCVLNRTVHFSDKLIKRFLKRLSAVKAGRANQ
jgi:DNA-binding NarL/FixJ family response regulator